MHHVKLKLQMFLHVNSLLLNMDKLKQILSDAVEVVKPIGAAATRIASDLNFKAAAD